MNDRIKAVRISLRLSQAEFGARIKLSQNYIWMIEKGERVPSDRTILDMCREFDVSEAWLRTGEGEMFVELSRDEEIAAFVGEALRDEKDDFKRRFLSMLSKLDESQWAMLRDMAKKMADE